MRKLTLGLFLALNLVVALPAFTAGDSPDIGELPQIDPALEPVGIGDLPKMGPGLEPNG